VKLFKTIALLLIVFVLGCTSGPDDASLITADEGGDIRWDIPAVREDGSPLALSEIGGYKIYTSTYANGWFTVLDDVQTNRYTFATS